VLLAAGAYQLSPVKDACLRQCRNPAQFLSRHYRPGRLGALRMGLLHGLWCLGCCCLLMALLFAGGIMDLAWIAALTLLVAAEKLLPFGQWVARGAGLTCLAGGAWLLFAQ
jgi:predicted metal-binding membrane protein